MLGSLSRRSSGLYRPFSSAGSSGGLAVKVATRKTARAMGGRSMPEGFMNAPEEVSSCQILFVLSSSRVEAAMVMRVRGRAGGETAGRRFNMANPSPLHDRGGVLSLALSTSSAISGRCRVSCALPGPLRWTPRSEAVGGFDGGEGAGERRNCRCACISIAGRLTGERRQRGLYWALKVSAVQLVGSQ